LHSAGAVPPLLPKFTWTMIGLVSWGVMSQLAVALLQPSEKLTTDEPGSGVAVKVSLLPTAKLPLQVAPQLIPAGVETTVPLPTPLLRTVMVLTTVGMTQTPSLSRQVLGLVHWASLSQPRGWLVLPLQPMAPLATAATATPNRSVRRKPCILWSPCLTSSAPLPAEPSLASEKKQSLEGEATKRY
jgi:hypothetical protein